MFGTVTVKWVILGFPLSLPSVSFWQSAMDAARLSAAKSSPMMETINMVKNGFALYNLINHKKENYVTIVLYVCVFSVCSILMFRYWKSLFHDSVSCSRVEWAWVPRYVTFMNSLVACPSLQLHLFRFSQVSSSLLVNFFLFFIGWLC